jgi:hypothetical protein
MPKFVVIDHSITDLAGHHYGYAAHVLDAAQRAGYQPVLATNRKYASGPRRSAGLGETRGAEAQWPIHRVYEFDFWAELEAAWPRRVLRAIANRLFRTCAVFRSRRVYRLQNAADNSARREPGEASPKPGVVHKLVRLLAGVYRRTLGHNHSVPPQKAKAAFARDTKLLFEKVEAGAGDIVFIPTISHRDMLGLLEFFRNGSQSAGASWHLLFRRSLPQFPVQGNAAANAERTEIHNAFEIFQREAGSRTIYFYTDSEELTEQYNQLGTSRFRTLPIPHTCTSQERILSNGPCRIAYLGDARCEKGYHLLPAIVRDLKTDYLETGKARLVVQSNLNPREGAGETAIARAELGCFPPSMVTLYNEPLSSDGYKDLLLNSDITLLPYERNDYSARSSGILAESLAAGIPVIVPAGTWLSRQLPPAPIQIDSPSQGTGETVPLGVVGLAYHEIEEIPGLIREIVDHYPHYRQTATEFAAEWRLFHNADRLVQELQMLCGTAKARYPG